MRVFALTFGNEEAASSQYRFFQYRERLAQEGIVCDHAVAAGFNDFPRLADYDVVLHQKTLLSRLRLRQLRRNARRLVYDTDDRIWLSPQKQHHWFTRWRIESRLRTIARQSDLCLAANEVIAEDLRARGAKTEVVPMALDGRKWFPGDRPGQPLRIGWSGSPKNLPFLRAIGPELREVQRRFPDVEWVFHCGADPALAGLRYRHLAFVPGQEPEAVRSFHIGLLPLPDDPFVQGKSPIKALQYLACGVAVAGAPVGATREILADGQNALHITGTGCSWVDGLTRLITLPEERQRLAAAGRASFLAQYDLPRVLARLKDLLVCVTAPVSV